MLGLERVLVPPQPGLCSALGAVTAELRSDRIATGYFRSDSLDADALSALVARLRSEASAELQAEGLDEEPALATRLGLRYVGQNYEHEVEVPGGDLDQARLEGAFAEFEELHDSFYGYNLRGQAIELVEIAVTARAPSSAPPPIVGGLDGAPTPPHRRPLTLAHGVVDADVAPRSSLAVGDSIAGPSVIEDYDSTVLLEPGDLATVLADRTLSIDVERKDPRE
jgi:N-methylhydantoinase A/oxoprolinase/acetone carboxylase beta subunit